MPDARHIGILKTYDPVKGYGFITRPEGKDVFVFFHDFEGSGDAAAIPGSTVEFAIVNKPGSKGPRAQNVSIVG